MSRPGHFFPATTDRIMRATGTISQISHAILLIVSKVENEQASDHTTHLISNVNRC